MSKISWKSDISTRPDCIREDYLDMLSDFREASGIEIGIELGLQTANYHTLERIRRGHGLAEYMDSCLRIKAHDFLLCTHVILNLPGDDLSDVIETSRIVSVLQNDLVKIHSLYIARGTDMGKDYENGLLDVCSKEDYFLRLQSFLENLHPNIGVERAVQPDSGNRFSVLQLADKLVEASEGIYGAHGGCRKFSGESISLYEWSRSEIF